MTFSASRGRSMTNIVAYDDVRYIRVCAKCSLPQNHAHYLPSPIPISDPLVADNNVLPVL